MIIVNTNSHHSQRPKTVVTRTVGTLAFCVAPLLVAACSSNGDSTTAETGLGTAREAVVGADCGFTVTSKVHGVSKNGFNVQVKVTNVTGTTSTAFSVLVQADQAQLMNVAHGSYQVTDYGYLLVADDSLTDSKLDPGQTYTFELKYDGVYTSFTPIVMSSNGSTCDQQAPDVSLTESGNFFTAGGTLNLAATASDNVAVAKVVFLQDGTPIGTATAEPYALSVPVTSALNGRHVYSAVAYDLAGNSASRTAKRVLVAINNKFFGTAMTTAVDYTNLPSDFNQVTPGNSGKWGSVQPNGPDQWNWTDLDTAYQFAKSHNFPFKMHTLIWGSQQPGWVGTLSAADQLVAIDNWMAAVAERYPNIDMIDVVNEPLHAPPSYIDALGGKGTTGFDWVIKAFEMARAHFPNAELLINDYSILTMSSTTQSYLALVNLLKDRGLVDGIGEQGHFYERAPEIPVLTTNLNSLAATGLPMYISELDLNFADDARQAIRMKDLFTALWSVPNVVGITHWGYLQGNMWQTNAYLVKSDGSLRPALTWIECFRAGGTDCTVPVYVPQPRTGDANGITLEAEDYDSAHDLLPAGSMVAYANNGSWLSFSKVAFNSNWNSLNVTYAHANGNPLSLTVHFGSLDNAPVATVALPATGDWSTMKTVSVPWVPMGSAQDVYVRFNGGGFNLDKINFTAPTGVGANLVSNSDFETAGKPADNSWNTWGSGTLAYTTTRAYSGSASLGMTGRSGNAPLAWNTTGENGWQLATGKYQVSVYATVGGVSSAQLVVQAKGADGAYLTAVNPTTVTNGTWTLLQGTITIAKAGFAQIWLQEGWTAGTPNAELYIDHVSIRPVVAAGNQLPNSNFESGIDGWTNYNGSATVATTTSWFHSGASALMGVATSASTNPNIYRDISSVVTFGKKYQISAWVSGGAGGAWIQLVNNFGCPGSGGFTTVQPGAWVNGGTWSQITGTMDYSACTGAFTYAQLWVGGGTGNTIYVDDVSLTLAQ